MPQTTQTNANASIRPVSTGSSNAISKSVAAKLTYLSERLPSTFRNYFDITPAGKYLGLSIRCPMCGYNPPNTKTLGLRLSGTGRWRYLAAHMAEKHGGQKRKEAK